jgi:hypothetical protein
MRQTYQKLERALKPIHDALEAVKSLPAPDFDTYAQWLTHQVVLQQGIQQGELQAGWRQPTEGCLLLYEGCDSLWCPRWWGCMPCLPYSICLYGCSSPQEHWMFDH